MPTFSNGSLDAVDTPFVDPKDITESIQSLGPSTTEETRNAVQKMLDTGALVHADVWLACAVRRNALADFMMSLKEEYERESSEGGQNSES
eukprot:CAMPEP_0185032650 /NCGR_PEP_ID=MMETSP1103-20130426/20900_1 /TAXON_ID=36769 /ORGANISM="Paraphysomonas bandaiensis, Strain Caron Lab Isolate" /LENGTH=90 /DNA_ID=CAMNT_0027568625 /DNA_START=293 /DNA_END=562 /DNA_ORIENTATION=-